MSKAGQTAETPGSERAAGRTTVGGAGRPFNRLTATLHAIQVALAEAITTHQADLIESRILRGRQLGGWYTPQELAEHILEVVRGAK